MSVTGASAAGREEKSRQIERLIHSSILQGSESLCKLLRYLADQAFEHPGVPVKEFQIATEVFARPATFDPRLDSTVRVQTGRLRAKLSDYYRGPGAHDPIFVEIPRGTYILSFVPRQTEVRSEPPLTITETVAHITQEPVPQAERRWFVAFCAVSALAAVLIAFVLLRPWPQRAATASRPEPSPVLLHFWAPFLDSPAPPWVVFSNAEFIGRPDQGMRYYDRTRDVGVPVLDHYTGVGEVLAIHELDRVFGSLNHDLRVKRGHLLSLDDVKNNDLIFVGSPTENLTLRDVPSTSEFQFRVVPDGPRKGDVMIVNAHPLAGEPKNWMASQIPLSEDYSVAAFVPGLNPTHGALILAGTTTIGTQAAVEFVTREGSARTLLERVSGSASQDLRPFEAVLHVSVKNGVPVRSDIVALHLPKR